MTRQETRPEGSYNCYCGGGSIHSSGRGIWVCNECGGKSGGSSYESDAVLEQVHLTKREEFAKAALQGLLAYGIEKLAGKSGEKCSEMVARNCVAFADALIAELNKTPEVS